LLDPLFMFVLLPKGMEVYGAALATLLSNVVSCVYLIAVIEKSLRRRRRSAFAFGTRSPFRANT
jgi:multidrug efflux pump